MIHFKHAVIGYSKPLLETGEIVLNSGMFYTLIGKNGIGKTTLLNTLLGITPTLNGSIWLSEHNIHRISNQQRSQKIAFVPSRFEGVQHLTTRDYIAMGRAPYTNVFGKLNASDWEVVDSVITQLRIEALAHADTSELSDGERQIASIAKALVQQTPVILLDEPTAFLDYSNRMAVQKLLREVAHHNQLCVLQSSHDLELCLEFSDRLLVIDSRAREITELVGNETTKADVIARAFPENDHEELKEDV